MDAESYLIDLKVHLALSSVIQSIEILDERIVLSNRGYFRARLTLVNGDFLEVSEYFVCEEENCFSKTYRYQWMDAKQKRLIKRWDNAEHFPDLPGFPHHIHLGREDNVEPSEPLSIIALLALIESEAGKRINDWLID